MYTRSHPVSLLRIIYIQFKGGLKRKWEEKSKGVGEPSESPYKKYNTEAMDFCNSSGVAIPRGF